MFSNEKSVLTIWQLMDIHPVLLVLHYAFTSENRVIFYLLNCQLIVIFFFFILSYICTAINVYCQHCLEFKECRGSGWRVLGNNNNSNIFLIFNFICCREIWKQPPAGCSRSPDLSGEMQSSTCVRRLPG